MSSKGGLSVGAVVVALGWGLLLSAPTTQATTYYWTTATGGIYAGNGTWSTTAAYWYNSTAGGSPDVAWTNSAANSADFYANSGSNGSTITVSGSVVVDNITFAGSGYTLAGGTLSLQNGSDITANRNAIIGSDISSGTITSNGAATLILTGSNTYTGLTTISGGTLQLGNGGTSGSINSTTIADNSVLAVNHSNTFTLSAAVTGTGSLIQAGTNTASDTLILTGNDTYSGATTINAGTLQVGSGGTAGALSGGGNVSDGGVLAFDNSGTTTFASAVSGAGSLRQMTGDLVLTGANTYKGGTTVGGGVLQFSADSAVPGTGTITINSGGALALDSAGNYSTVTGWLDSGLIAPSSAGALALVANDSETINISGYAGLSLGTIGSVTFSGALVPGGATYNLGGGGGTLTFAPAMADSQSGSMGLNVSGPGTVVLTGSNTYSGPTRITAGTLQMGVAVGPPSAPPSSVLEYDFTGLGTTGNTVPGGTTITNLGSGGILANGTMVGSAATLVAGPKGKQGLAFNTSYITTPYSSVINLNTWTNSVWVDVSGSAGQTEILDARNPTDNPGGANFGCDEFYYPSSGSFYTEIAPAGGGWLSAPTNTLAAPLSNGWHLITTTMTTGAEQIYVDGALIATNNFSGTPALMVDATDSLGVGEGATLPMADFNLFNTVLTAAQVQTMYYGGVFNGFGGLPATTPLRLAGGAVFDLNGISQTVASLADDSPGAAGTVTNNGALAAVLTLAPTGGSATFSGAIQDSAAPLSLTLDGSGTQILAGSNTYSGATTISAGTLQIGTGGGAGSINGTSGVVDNGVLAFSRSGTVTFMPSISGGGGVTQMGPGVLLLTGANTYTGPTCVSGGTLQDMPRGLLVHFTMDGTLGTISNNATITDSSGYGNNGTMVGSGASRVGGKFNQGIQLTASPYISVPNSTSMQVNQWTTNVWINGGTGWLYSNRYPTGGHDSYGGDESYDGTTISLDIANANGYWYASGLTDTVGALSGWTMVTTTVSSASWQIYLDGALSASGTFAAGGGAPKIIEPFASQLTVGVEGGSSYTGSLDDFSLYGSVLTPAQIAALYAGPAPYFSGALPGNSPVQIAGGAVYDLAGAPEILGSLSDLNGGGGKVTDSVTGALTLTLAPTGSSSFSGVIQNGAGTVSLLLAGSGTQILAGSNTYSGGTPIQSGVLSISNDYNLGASTGPLAIAGGTLQSAGAVTLNSQRAVTVGVGAGIDVVSGTLIYGGAIANAGDVAGTLTKTSSGVLQLDGNNTYTGATAVNVGTLAGAGTLASTVTVNALAQIAPGDNVSGNFGGVGTLSLGGLTLSSSAVADFDLGTHSDLLAVSGALVLDGATLNVENSGGLSAGTYDLISYGSLPGGFNAASSLLLGSLPTGFFATIVNNSSTKQIDLDVIAVKTWTGVHSSAWDTTTANWSVSGSAATYNSGDPVVFGDTASTGSVSVAGTVAPLSWTVDNNSLSYTFSGSGAIAGGVALVKEGNGTLAVNMAGNTYSGGSNLAGGVLQIGASSTVSGGTLASGPFGSGPLNLSGGTLQDGGAGYTLANAVNITGNVTLAGAGSGGLTLGPEGLSAPNTVTITGSPTIYVTAPTTIADQITGALVKDGPGTLTLTAATNSLSGTTLVDNGSLVGTLANLATPITLANGANVTFYQATAGTLTAPVNGVGSLGNSGPGVLTLGTLQQYSGATKISSGTLQLSAPAYQPALMHLAMDGAVGPVNNGDPIPDASGSGNNGNMIGGGASYVPGQFGQGINFTVGQYVQAPPINNGVLGSYTVSLWMDITGGNNSQGWHSICSTRSGAGPNTGAMQIAYADSAQGGPGIYIENWTNLGWGFYGTIPAPTLTTDAWHLVTATFQTGSLSLYVDSSLVANESFTGLQGFFGSTAIPIMTPEDEPFLIGYSGLGGANFNGAMDDFDVYDEALTPAQIVQLYNVGNPQIIVGGSLPTNTPVQIAHGATFDLNGLPQSVDSLANLAGNGGTVTTTVAGSVTLTLAPAGTTTFSGVIQDGAGQISVTMSGPGTQVFAGSNTYSGATTVNGGVLEIAGSGVYSAGFTINGGGTLEVGGLGVIDNTSLSGSGTVLVAPGGSMIAQNFASTVVVAGGTLSGALGGTPAIGSVLVSAGSVSLASGQTIAVGNGGLLIAPGASATVNMTGGLLVQGGFGSGANWWGGSVNVGDPSAGGPGGASFPAVLNISGGTLQAGNWANGNGGAGLQVGVGGAAGVVNQSGGVVNVEGWDAFAVGGAIFGQTPGQGTYNLSGGTLNTGYYGNGYTEVGVAGGTGVMKVSGGVWNISADAPVSPGPGGGQGGASLLNIGSGNAPDGDAAGTGSVVISGGQVNAFGGITVGDVYSQGGSAGLLSLQGGLLDLTSGSAGYFGGMILVGSGGTLVAGSGTLQNVAQILGNATINGMTASGLPMPLTVSGPGLLVLAGTNTYTGGTTLTGGTLSITNSSAVGSGGLSIGPQGVFDLNAQNCIFPSLSGSAGGVLTDLSTVATGVTTLTVNSPPSGSSNYGGTICDGSSRTLSLVVSGSGMLTLSGTSTYSGGTTVSGGTLDFSTPESMPSTGVLDIQSGGEVVLGVLLGDLGGDSEPAAADVAADGASNSNTKSGEATSGDSVIEALLARIRAERVGGSAGGTAVGSMGSATATGIGAVILAVSPAVPEPSTFVLLGVAAIGLFGWMWRRRKRA